jgi:hypothetical protein
MSLSSSYQEAMAVAKQWEYQVKQYFFYVKYLQHVCLEFEIIYKKKLKTDRSWIV